LTKVRPDMLYQYLMDEVARKRIKVVKKGDENIALDRIDDGDGNTRTTRLGAGEPVKSKDTGLLTVMSRSRSEKQGKTRKKPRGLFLGVGHRGGNGETSDDSTPPTPRLPALAESTVEGEVVKRDNRLTM